MLFGEAPRFRLVAAPATALMTPGLRGLDPIPDGLVQTALEQHHLVHGFRVQRDTAVYPGSVCA
jgi:hypothetical protein